MIIIGGKVVNPLYTRVTISRAFIQAEIAIHSKILKDSYLLPITPIFVMKYGILYIDSVIQQGENIIIRAYDPLAYYCKYRYVTKFNKESEGTWESFPDSHAPYVMYEFLYAQTDAAELDSMSITLIPPAEDVGNPTAISARYDNVFDVYTKIPESYDSGCRMNITPVYTSDGNTIYQPMHGNDTPKRLEVPYTVDYAQHATIPTKALVLSKTRSEIIPVGSGMRQLYVNAILTPKGEHDLFLQDIGLNALAAAKSENTNITVRMLEKYLPDIKPADAILINNDTPYTVYSIEHTTSPQGEWAYLSCGGHIMSVADRINALIAADYASRI